MALKSKYDSRCYKCGVRFKVGIDWIESDTVNGKRVWFHVTCPQVAKTYTTSLAEQNYTTKASPVYKASINMPIPIEEAAEQESALDDLSAAIDASSIDETEEGAKREEFKSFVPSIYQKAIFEAISNMADGTYPSQHLVIEAVAGSGKTTTIVKALDLTPKAAKVAFIAFNKHIAAELQKRAPSHVHVSTMHSLGLSIIRSISPKVQIDDDKVGSFLDPIWPVSKDALKSGLITHSQRKVNFMKRLSMRKVISICKATLTDENNVQAVMDMLERYNVEIELDFIDEIISKLPDVMTKCKEELGVVDFNDMPWLPVVLNIKAEQFDYLMVDEAQDLSKGNIEFILRCVKEDGHIIAVGDRFQSLYAFRGADSEAIPNLIDKLNATILPLSVTYRCPASHVRKAQELVPQLEARENAPEGEIREVEYFDLVKQLEPGDMVICRTNAPLIRPAFECIRKGIKAMIRGKDIGASLIALIKRFETDDLGSFEINLNEYYEIEYQKYLDKGKEMQAMLLQDRVETLRFIMNECATVSELNAKIAMLFSDNNTGVVFSSVHRAKGLEASRVFILRPDLMPHPKAKKEWEVQQENNTLYVAETRSKAELIFVKGDGNQ